MPVTPPVTEENVQAALKEALDAIAALPGSPTAGVPVLEITWASLSPLGETSSQMEEQIKQALETLGLCFVIGLPGTSARDSAENAGVLFNLAPPLGLYVNVTKLHPTPAASASAKNPYALIRHVLARLLGRPVTTGNLGGQKWHVAAAPFGQPVETKTGLMIPLNVTLPATLTRTP